MWYYIPPNKSEGKHYGHYKIVAQIHALQILLNYLVQMIIAWLHKRKYLRSTINDVKKNSS